MTAILCSMINVVRPSSRPAASTFRIRSIRTGFTPAVGSSRRRVFGSVINAIPIESSFISPPESTSAKSFACRSRPSAARSLQARSSRSCSSCRIRCAWNGENRRRMLSPSPRAGATIRFSSRVMRRATRGTWKVRMSPRWASSCGRAPSSGTPSSSTRPASFATKPVMTSNRVVLPEPFGPIKPVTAAGAATSETPPRTVTAPNRLTIRSIERSIPYLRLAHDHHRPDDHGRVERETRGGDDRQPVGEGHAADSRNCPANHQHRQPKPEEISADRRKQDGIFARDPDHAPELRATDPLERDDDDGNHTSEDRQQPRWLDAGDAVCAEVAPGDPRVVVHNREKERGNTQRHQGPIVVIQSFRRDCQQDAGDRPCDGSGDDPNPGRPVVEVDDPDCVAAHSEEEAHTEIEQSCQPVLEVQAQREHRVDGGQSEGLNQNARHALPRCSPKNPLGRIARIMMSTLKATIDLYSLPR